MQSPRRGWIAQKGVDPALIAAARIGVVVSCVSQARRLELWTHPSNQWHVAAAPHTALLQQTDAHVHWSTPLVPRPPGVFEDSIENVLALVAACQPREHALAIWESALSRGLADRETMSGYPLRPAARELCELMMPFADSGLETIVIPRLRWLRLPMRRQIWIAGHRVDLLIGERLVLQIDGGTHVDAQRMIDNEHDAALRLMGYHVIRVGRRQILDDWATVQDLVMRAVAQGLHRAPRG